MSVFSSILSLLSLLSGCSGNGQLPVAPTQCALTLDGQPLAGAKVVFTPTAGRSAFGETDADGVAPLSTYGNGDGAIVGKHTVIVVGPQTQSSSFDPDTPVGDSGIPSIYGEPGKSGLSWEVKPGQKNEAKFDLTGTKP